MKTNKSGNQEPKKKVKRTVATKNAVARDDTITTREERDYYLMKSEPNVFSIDDLENRKEQIEPWDGML